MRKKFTLTQAATLQRAGNFKNQLQVWTQMLLLYRSYFQNYYSAALANQLRSM